jgi:hypothetical protein
MATLSQLINNYTVTLETTLVGLNDTDRENPETANTRKWNIKISTVPNPATPDEPIRTFEGSGLLSEIPGR